MKHGRTTGPEVISGRQIALKVRERMEELSPLIEHFTSEVCPECRDVCCKQKHGIPDKEDRHLFFLLNSQPPELDTKRAPDDYCQFLSDRGCILPRWQRPFRCTWYFCETLLRVMPERDPRGYRKMISLLQEVILLRQHLTPNL